MTYKPTIDALKEIITATPSLDMSVFVDETGILSGFVLVNKRKSDTIGAKYLKESNRLVWNTGKRNPTETERKSVNNWLKDMDIKPCNRLYSEHMMNLVNENYRHQQDIVAKMYNGKPYANDYAATLTQYRYLQKFRYEMYFIDELATEQWEDHYTHLVYERFQQSQKQTAQAQA